MTWSWSMMPCECQVCQVARANIRFGTALPAKNLVRCPSRTGTDENEICTPWVLKLCSSCLTELQSGKPHEYTKTTWLKNMKLLVSAGSPKSSEKLSSSILKEKCGESKQPVSLAVIGGGHSMKLKISPDTEKFPIKSRFTATDISQIQQDLDLSNRETLRLGQHLRAAATSRQVISLNLQQHLLRGDHLHDKHF